MRRKREQGGEGMLTGGKANVKILSGHIWDEKDFMFPLFSTTHFLRHNGMLFR